MIHFCDLEEIVFLVDSLSIRLATMVVNQGAQLRAVTLAVKDIFQIFQTLSVAEFLIHIFYRV